MVDPSADSWVADCHCTAGSQHCHTANVDSSNVQSVSESRAGDLPDL